MAAVVVGADSVRYDAMEALTNVASIGGGAGATIEPDIVYQGTNSISRKVTAAGFTSNTGVNRNMTLTGRKVWMLKLWVTNYAQINATGLEVRIGSTAGAGSNYYSYRLFSSSSTEKYPAKGGFIIDAIDPNISEFRTLTNGTPSLTAVAAYGTVGNFGATSKAENLVMDAIDVGSGLFLYGGDGANTNGKFENFVTFDEVSSSTGRYGHVLTEQGILYVRGRLVIGASSSSENLTTFATEFEDSNRTLIFPHTKTGNGFSGIICDLNSSTTIDMTSCQFVGRGFVTNSIDTRPIFTASGSVGNLDLIGCSFQGFSTMLLSSSFSAVNCTFLSCSRIDQSGSYFDDCKFTNHTTTLSSAYIISREPNRITNSAFSNISGSGHAIELRATGSFTLQGNTFLGYGSSNTGNAAVFNNSSGSVTLNITGGGSTPTIRNGTNASTTVNSNVSITLTGLKNPSEVRVFNAGTQTEIAGQESITGGSFVFSVSSGVSVDISILSLGYQNQRLLSYSTTSDVTLPISQQLDRQYLNP